MISTVNRPVRSKIQNPRSYNLKYVDELETIVSDNSDNLFVLIDVHAQALSKRTTRRSIKLRIKTEAIIKEIIYSKWSNHVALKQMLSKISPEKTNFATEISLMIIERLKEVSFRFPSTELTGEGFPEMKIIDRQKNGLLLAVGYKTGLYGLHNEPRRKILNDLYQGEIPKDTGLIGIEKWGRPRTRTRLKEIVYQLAHFTKQEKKNYRGDYSTSISEREADLKYLKKKYYDGVYDFEYPKT